METAKLKALLSLSEDPLLRLSDVLSLLKVRHRSTVLRWSRSGKIALLKVGKCYRVRASEVLRISQGVKNAEEV